MAAKKNNATETMLGIATGFMILFWWLQNQWLLYIAIAAGLIGLFVKPLALLVEKGWMLLTKAIGYVNSRLILGLIFFVILFPIALLARLGRKDPLKLKGGGDTFYTIRNHKFSKEDLENPW